MKPDRLINKINQINEDIETSSKKIKDLKRLRSNLYETIITKGISFVPYDLIDAIRYFVMAKDGKNYNEEEGTWYVEDKLNGYLMLYPDCDTRNYLYQPENIIIYNKLYTVLQEYNLDHNTLTFQHLLDKYNVEDWVGCVNPSNFEYHPYLKDFITYLSDIQIENDGKLLSHQEMMDATKAYIASQKDEDIKNRNPILVK